MADGKWIPGLDAGTPLADAARRVLGVRLEVVRDNLGPALREPGKDPEYVHHLRVGTRRARVALDIFAPCLPSKSYREAKRTLRTLRRAAGEARDWDVFIATLGRQAASQAQPGLDCLIGYALAQRLAAQVDLCRSVPDPFAFDRFYTELLGEVREPASECRTFVDVARSALLALLEELDRAAATDLDDYQNLHQVRIVGKRLRYAMEIFAGCFPPIFREVHYASVEEMQEILGRINDSHVALGRLIELGNQTSSMIPDQWPRYQPAIEGLIHFHRERLPADRALFDQWWGRWLEEPEGKRGVLDLLQR